MSSSFSVRRALQTYMITMTNHECCSGVTIMVPGGGLGHSNDILIRGQLGFIFWCVTFSFLKYRVFEILEFQVALFP